MIADVARDAVPGDASDARRHDLDADHQRRREQHAPQHAEAELRAGLRVGGDPARVVVGRAGDESGPRRLKKLRARLIMIEGHADHDRAGAMDAAAREYNSGALQTARHPNPLPRAGEGRKSWHDSVARDPRDPSTSRPLTPALSPRAGESRDRAHWRPRLRPLTPTLSPLRGSEETEGSSRFARTEINCACCPLDRAVDDGQRGHVHDPPRSCRLRQDVHGLVHAEQNRAQRHAAARGRP